MRGGWPFPRRLIPRIPRGSDVCFEQMDQKLGRLPRIPVRKNARAIEASSTVLSDQILVNQLPIPENPSQDKVELVGPAAGPSFA